MSVFVLIEEAKTQTSCVISQLGVCKFAPTLFFSCLPVSFDLRRALLE